MSLAHIDNNLPATPAAPATGGGGLLALNSISDAVGLAEQIANTPFVPAAYRGRKHDVLACILYGHELGLGPMQALNSIDIVQGSVFLRAQLVAALARSVGGAIDVHEATPERAVVLARRPGWGEARAVEFTIEEARAQRLTEKSGPWKSDPKGMLVNRATTRAGRWYFSDVLKGIYVEGEDPGPGTTGGVTLASEPVESTSFAQLAERRRAELPGATVPSAVPLNEEGRLLDVPLPDPSEGDDYLNWEAADWHRACAGKLPLPEISQRFRVGNFGKLAAADADVKTAVYQALVEATGS